MVMQAEELIMKRNAVKIITVIMSVALVLCSCSESAGTLNIREKSVSGSIKADDGTVVYSYEVDYPEISITGKKDIAKKINSALSDETSKITEPVFDYVAEYKDYVSRGAQYVSGARFSESFVKTYCDDEIISFEIMLYCHEACAMRDTEETRGVTFSLNTGDTVSVYDIAADGDNFKEKIITETERQLSKLGKEKDTDDISLEDAFAVIDRQGFEWYLTDENICILFAPGDAAPVMLGTLVVEIPIDESIRQPSNGSTASVSGVSS